MDNIVTRNIENGTRLMEDALRMYSNGNNKLAYSTVKKAEECLREAYEAENTKEGIDAMKYGDNLNFGALYKVFESNTAAMFKDPSKHGNLKRIVETINSNRVLKDEFNAYNAFTNPKNVTDAGKYVDEAYGLIKKHTKAELLENNRELMKAMRDCGLNEDVSFSEEETGLFESVEYLMTSRKGFGNLAEFSAAKNIIKEYVENNNRIENEEENIDAKYDEELNEIADKYEKMLSEDEIELVKNAQDPAKSKSMFDNLKEKLTGILEKLSASGNEASSWKEILEKVKSKVYNSETAIQDIAEFMEILGEVETEE